MAGIDDVARRAGVSATTVSRALSGRGRVSEKTRERVRRVADELGYVASATAASLATGQTMSVGVLVSLTGRWYFATVLDGIAARLAPHGYDLTLYDLTDDAAQRQLLFETSLRRGRVDGILALTVTLSDDEIDALLGLGLPVVGLGTPSPRVPALRVDDRAVARAAVAHLLALGHRRIAHIGNSKGPGAGCDVPTQRHDGFVEAMTDAGVPCPVFVQTDFTVADGRRATLELLQREEPPTAIFAASDELAFGAIFAARERGLRVPDDLSIVGVDGHEMGELFGLTTIDQFPRRQGERAAEHMLALLTATDDPTPPAAPPATVPVVPARVPDISTTVPVIPARVPAISATVLSEPLPFELVTRTSTAPPAE
ncbi:LacI family DNA-binding transcriptional regulator [Microbacterium sp. No. 7]|uniref:LacI family DNA-binding transcriptional regulator n=1 Tax=Microbacterium sp. No. 7 TaxID=1714373 RepID=UPI0009EAC04D|nr:LacI family DNA-binding transcriptional regulator [Microbacterium sp. No. 7]